MKLPLLKETLAEGVEIDYLVLVVTGLVLVLINVALFVNQCYKYQALSSSRGKSSLDSALCTMSICSVVAVLSLVGMVFLRADSICRSLSILALATVSYLYTVHCIQHAGGQVYLFELFKWTDVPNDRFDCGTLLFPKVIQRQNISLALKLMMQNIFIAITTQLLEQLVISDNYYTYPCPIIDNPLKLCLELLQVISFLISMYGGMLISRAAQLTKMPAAMMRLGLIKWIQLFHQLQHLSLVMLADRQMLYAGESVEAYDYPVGPDTFVVRINIIRSVVWANFAVICQCFIAQLIYVRHSVIIQDGERYKPLRTNKTLNRNKLSDKETVLKSLAANMKDGSENRGNSNVSLVGGRLCIVLSEVETERLINSTPDVRMEEINEIFEMHKQSAVVNRRGKSDDKDTVSFSSIATC